MPQLDVSAAWERLDEGDPEERACFGMVTVRCENILLSEGLDGFVDCRRDGPLVSNYHLAEWLAWNWWRLTSEPRRPRETAEWSFSHRLTTIGEGYIWPNITIWSDLERTCLVAKPSQKREFAAFRSTANWVVMLPTGGFEHAVERYVGQVQGQLRARRVAETNLDRIWDELRDERNDPALTRRRRLEALLGSDPDDADPAILDQLVEDAPRLGLRAIDEVAVDQPTGRQVPGFQELNEIAHRAGTDANPADAVRLERLVSLPSSADAPAWKRGSMAAQALRQQENPGHEPLSDDRLAELAGVSGKVLGGQSSTNSFSFALDTSETNGRVVLRSKWRTGRRFELARLLGDRIAVATGERLLPATRSYTYRQQLQRAFAAEFLCPLDDLTAQLDGDYSDEAIDAAANYFDVSPLTVRTLLVNHGWLPREDIEQDLDVPAVA